MNLASTAPDSFTGVFTVAIVGFYMALILRIRDFVSKPDGLAELASQHSSGCIGKINGVARSALFLAEAGSSFPDGTATNIDCGIASRLHDPD